MKISKCLLVIIVIIFVVAVSADAGSKAVTVSADGTGMYNSIQQAIDNVAPGTIIRIGAGIYEENLMISKPLKPAHSHNAHLQSINRSVPASSLPTISLP